MSFEMSGSILMECAHASHAYISIGLMESVHALHAYIRLMYTND